MRRAPQSRRCSSPARTSARPTPERRSSTATASRYMLPRHPSQAAIRVPITRPGLSEISSALWPNSIVPLDLETMTYERDGRIARITLDRPERGNGITLEMPRELAHCVERANLDPAVRVIALAGHGKGFCGGYDLVVSAEGSPEDLAADGDPGSPIDPATIARNHDPSGTWDPVVDWQMMSRNLRGFMSLFHSDKPVVCKVHGFCVAGGTDMAL